MIKKLPLCYIVERPSLTDDSNIPWLLLAALLMDCSSFISGST